MKLLGNIGLALFKIACAIVTPFEAAVKSLPEAWGYIAEIPEAWRREG